MSYNVLAHCYTIGNSAGFYKRQDLSLAQDWLYRGRRVLWEIESVKPNIVCLNEVDHWDELYKAGLQ